MTEKKQPGHGFVAGGLRFLTELIAWVLVPLALWPRSAFLAIAAVLLLIGLPTLFNTPGDRPRGTPVVPVPGVVTILLVLLQLAAATAAAWVLGPLWLALVVTALCVLVTVTEQPRWRWLMGASARSAPTERRS
ncbi:hypothetical protein [Amycolatopsis dongchuanensis]|uniref:Integral membrane protein n=1 Tax=Amycolatopsis dongchuanensis TaxID=1070866 RepID=A0ABP8VNM5_9PSEU